MCVCAFDEPKEWVEKERERDESKGRAAATGDHFEEKEREWIQHEIRWVSAGTAHTTRRAYGLEKQEQQED